MLRRVQSAHSLQLTDGTLHRLCWRRLQNPAQEGCSWPQAQQMNLKHQLFQRHPHHLRSLSQQQNGQIGIMSGVQSAYVLQLRRYKPGLKE